MSADAWLRRRAIRASRAGPCWSPAAAPASAPASSSISAARARGWFRRHRQADAAQALVGSWRRSGRRRASSDATCATSRRCRRRWPSVEADSGPVAVLVNNAANDDRHRIEDVSAAYWDERIAVNLRHQFFAAQAVTPGMMRGGRRLDHQFRLGQLACSSEGGMPAYATAKAAVEGLTRSLARELGPDNIRVNMRRARLGDDRAADRSCGSTPEGEAEIDARQCLQGPAAARRHRAHGAVPRGRRQPRCAPRRTSSSTRAGSDAPA